MENWREEKNWIEDHWQKWKTICLFSRETKEQNWKESLEFKRKKEGNLFFFLKIVKVFCENVSIVFILCLGKGKNGGVICGQWTKIKTKEIIEKLDQCSRKWNEERAKDKRKWMGGRKEFVQWEHNRSHTIFVRP